MQQGLATSSRGLHGLNTDSHGSMRLRQGFAYRPSAPCKGRGASSCMLRSAAQSPHDFNEQQPQQSLTSDLISHQLHQKLQQQQKAILQQNDWQPQQPRQPHNVQQTSSEEQNDHPHQQQQQAQQQQRGRTPAAMAAVFTGSYAITAGLALTLTPITAFGLLFDASAVPAVWIRVGGLLFTLIGLQYLGAGLSDARLPTQQDSMVTPTPAEATSQVPQGKEVAVLGYARSFYMATIGSRAFLCAGFLSLVVFWQAPLGLLLLGALNLAGAAAMYRAVKATDTLLGVCT